MGIVCVGIPCTIIQQVAQTTIQLVPVLDWFLSLQLVDGDEEHEFDRDAIFFLIAGRTTARDQQRQERDSGYPSSACGYCTAYR
jgi:hypothetical protein